MERDLLAKTCSDRAKGFKVQESRFRLEVRKKVFMMRVLKH